MSEEDCRLALKDVLRDGFAKDQKMVELKTINHTLNQQLNHANNISLAASLKSSRKLPICRSAPC
ncbi:hypothetical protein AVM47_000255 [Pseudomonas aeruginosa]|nr:hypothetical protein [Pseudomonas aeruginosa]